MNPRDAEADLSAYLDDALNPVEREAVRLRIERDPDARRTVQALGAASAVLKGVFAAESREHPELLLPPPALTAEGLAAAEVAGRRGLVVRLSSLVALAAAICVGGFYVLRGESSAVASDRVAAAAARVVKAEEAYVEIVASAPAAALLLGSSPSVRGVLGPGGRFYGEIKMPSGGRSGGAMSLFGPLAAPSRRGAGADGSSDDENARRGARVMHAGFDGDQLWRYAEGDAHVEVAPVDPAWLADARDQLSSGFGADLLFGASGPELGFSAWREIATQAAAGKFEVSPAGDRAFEGGKLALYVIRAGEGSGAKVRQATVGVDGAGDLRLIEVNMFRIVLRKMTSAPAADRFSFRAYAPADAELRPVLLPSSPKRRNG